MTFEEELISNRKDLYKEAYKITRNINDSDDLVQDTFLRALDKQKYYSNNGTPMIRWLISVMKSVFYNKFHLEKRIRLRNAKAKYEIPVHEESLFFKNEKEAESEKVVKQVREWVDEIKTKKHRDVMHALLDIDDGNQINGRARRGAYNQVAERLGISYATVKSRVHTSKDLLIKLL